VAGRAAKNVGIHGLSFRRRTLKPLPKRAIVFNSSRKGPCQLQPLIPERDCLGCVLPTGRVDWGGTNPLPYDEIRPR
jgi:hypothetical protein